MRLKRRRNFLNFSFKLKSTWVWVGWLTTVQWSVGGAKYMKPKNVGGPVGSTMTSARIGNLPLICVRSVVIRGRRPNQMVYSNLKFSKTRCCLLHWFSEITRLSNLAPNSCDAFTLSPPWLTHFLQPYIGRHMVRSRTKRHLTNVIHCRLSAVPQIKIKQSKPLQLSHKLISVPQNDGRRKKVSIVTFKLFRIRFF